MEKNLKEMHIGVLMGGISREREISLRSGKNCLDALNELGYRVSEVDVGRDIASVLADMAIDVAFLALHGRYGEDGAIQGLLEILGIPYTGSRVTASALAMNKIICKQMVACHGIPTPPFRSFGCRDDLDAACAAAAGELRFPLMVKPCEEGSSLGVIKVEEPGGLRDAVGEACESYDLVLAEEFIEGEEITVGLLEIAGELTALPVLQLVPSAGFYDFDSKYQAGMTEFILPAEIPEQAQAVSREQSLLIHRALGCRGFSRVDFMIDTEGIPQFTEINTLPGMTDTSDLPAQAQAAGIGYAELVEYMLQSAFLP